MIRRHTQTAQTAYHDLISLLLDEAASEIRGTPTKRERGERTYWYDRYRIGKDIKEHYLGEDSDRLRDRIAKHESLKERRRQRKRERARLVKLLRGERFLGLDGNIGSLLSALAKAGVFRLGGVLVGTNAFRMYEGELGLRLSLDQAAVTNDIDIANFEKLSLALKDHVSPGLDEVFSDFEFEPIPSLDAEKVWRWRQSNSETRIEFLTPSFEDDEAVRDLAALGVSAQSLHHLNYLLSDPIHVAAIYRDGILIHVPRPEKFAVHKLIVADRRRDGTEGLKARKDHLQAEVLIEILAEERPADLAEAYESALSQGPRWRERLERSLAKLPKSKDLIERSLEELQ